MSETVAAKPMTSEELFALPHSKRVDRWLFRGELRESKVTKRNPNHAGAVMEIGGCSTNGWEPSRNRAARFMVVKRIFASARTQRQMSASTSH